MVITSLNLHKFSISNNREMGVLIKRETDKKLFKEAILEAESILKSTVNKKSKFL